MLNRRDFFTCFELAVLVCLIIASNWAIFVESNMVLAILTQSRANVKLSSILLFNLKSLSAVRRWEDLCWSRCGDTPPMSSH